MIGTIIDRELPSPEAVDLLVLTRELVVRELAPRADKSEAAGSFPRELAGPAPRSARFGG